VEVIGPQRPGIHGDVVSGDECGDSVKEVEAIVVGNEDGAPFDAAIDDLMEHQRCIETHRAGHAPSVDRHTEMTALHRVTQSSHNPQIGVGRGWAKCSLRPHHVRCRVT